MDATRARRTRDRARQGWYARYRQWRFARYLGFGEGVESPVYGSAAVRSSLKDRSVSEPCKGPNFLDREPVSPLTHRRERSYAMATR